MGNIKQNFKKNGVVDIEVLENVVNELKLINDVLGVEHSIDTLLR
jgi:hypothetical protein